MFSYLKNAALGLGISIMLSVPSVFAEEVNCLKVNPVKLHAAPQYDYLKEGVMQTVKSRLAEKGVSVVDGCDDSELTVNITLFGGGSTVSMGVSAGGEAILNVSRSGKEDELLSQVVALTDDISRRLADTSAAVTSPAPAPQKEKSVAIGEKRHEIRDMRTRPMDGKISTVATGDIDGDGRVEGVAVSSDRLYLLAFERGGVVVKRDEPLKSYLRNIRANLYDFDGDGRDELILAGIHTANETPVSRILAFNEKEGWAAKVSDVGLMLDVVRMPGAEKSVCLGQGMRGLDFVQPVWEVRFKDGQLQRQAFDAMPEVFSLLGWNSFSSMDGDAVHLFRLNPAGGLELWENGTKRIWRKDAGYGASLNYVQYEQNRNSNIERRILPARIQRVDGKTIKGAAMTQSQTRFGGLFEGMKGYKKGRVVVLNWNGYEEEGLAATKGYEGFLPDFSVGDFDGDGKLEAFFPVVQGTSLSKARSYFVLSDLE